MGGLRLGFSQEMGSWDIVSVNSVLPVPSSQRRVPILSRASRFTICHKTEVVKNTLNPVWQPFSIPVRALCNGDYDRSVGTSWENREPHQDRRLLCPRVMVGT